MLLAFGPLEEKGMEIPSSGLLSAESERDTEAELPVPDQSTPSPDQLRKRNWSWFKRSQKIGLLLRLHSQGRLSSRARTLLEKLAGSASEEELQAAFRWSSRFKNPDFLRRFRLEQEYIENLAPPRDPPPIPEKRRIGVGYRDKGNLPDHSSQARVDANRTSWISLNLFSPYVRTELKARFPELVEGGLFDLMGLYSTSDEELRFLRSEVFLGRL